MKSRMAPRRIHSSLILALTSLLGVLVVGIVSVNSQTNNSVQLPAALKPCIPSAQVAKAEFVSKTRWDKVEYYLLSAYELNDTQGTDLVISLKGDRCKQVFYNPMGDPISLASAVGRQVARQLTLGRYQREIEEIGREKFQQQINESVSQVQQVVWWDEEVWALQQLKLKLPQNVIVK